MSGYLAHKLHTSLDTSVTRVAVARDRVRISYYNTIIQIDTSPVSGDWDINTAIKIKTVRNNKKKQQILKK